VTDPEYRVLARKYRPQSFAELIGQDALVRTLTHAIGSGRLVPAYMLTGVRGVGKTTTARILARALNCIGPDGQGGATATPCGICGHCSAIAADRHPDYQEMDAASRTGVADIRELLDGVRFGPVSARYKVYVIDEVHMLSGNAFNALAKTLGNPPEHTKFIFATTEIHKVPALVLGQCQRFDLRRVNHHALEAHFTKVASLERAGIEAEAIAMIARAADGSVRDGLSVLDQAISLGDGTVSVSRVREMLGLADRGRILDLLEHTMDGRPDEALAIVRDLHDAGGDPAAILQDLVDLVHMLTRFKVVPETLRDRTIPEFECEQGGRLAGCLAMSTLSKTFQMLIKGIGEVQEAPVPIDALEMVLVRLAFMADTPTPADVLRTP
jgi:DNA polymerase-3 subunit gamma/tau